MPICWDSLNKQQFLQCDNPGQPQTRISVEISVNVYEGQWVFPAVLHEGPDSCLGINVLVTSVLHHHPTHAMPMNSRTEAKKPVAGPGQFLPVVLEDKAQLWWRWWWWLDLVSSSTCGGMEGPAVWLGLNTGLPSPLPACSSLYPAKLGQSERDRDMVTSQFQGMSPIMMKITVSLRVRFITFCSVSCVPWWLAGPVPALPAPPNWLCLLSAAKLPAGTVCFYINTQSQSQWQSQATQCGNNNSPTTPPSSYQLTVLRHSPSLSRDDLKQKLVIFKMQIPANIEIHWEI